MCASSRTEIDSRPLRVALVVERFSPAGGGVERVAWELAHALARGGDDIHVVAHAGDAAVTGDSDDAGRTAGPVTLHRVDVPTGSRALRSLEFSRSARRVTEAQAFDVVHGFARVHAQDLFHAGLGCHAEYLRAVHRPLGRAVRRFTPRHLVQLQLEAQIARDPGIRIQCVSESVAQAFRTHYGVPDDRLLVVPNGVDLARFGVRAAPDDSAPLRASLAPGADAVWLFVGSGFRRKGLETALEALAASRIEKSVLWVVGRDRVERWKRRAARLGVADRVRFLGEREDVHRLLAASDGLLLPTRYEPGGLVVLEAAASGVPVVTSAACGHAELIEDAALVIPSADDSEAFAEALDRLADGGLRRRLARAGRRRTERLGWDEIAVRLRSEYAQIAGARRHAQ